MHVGWVRRRVILEDVSGESLIFESTTNSQAPWTSPFFEDVSSESCILNIRGLKIALSASNFVEDVSGDSSIFEDQKILDASRIPTSPSRNDAQGS